MLPNTIVNIITVKINRINSVMMFGFSVIRSAKSAEPPINVLFSFVRALRVNSEAFLEARLLFSLREFCFSFFKALEKLFLKNFIY